MNEYITTQILLLVMPPRDPGVIDGHLSLLSRNSRRGRLFLEDYFLGVERMRNFSVSRIISKYLLYARYI